MSTNGFSSELNARTDRCPPWNFHTSSFRLMPLLVHWKNSSQASFSIISMILSRWALFQPNSSTEGFNHFQFVFLDRYTFGKFCYAERHLFEVCLYDPMEREARRKICYPLPLITERKMKSGDWFFNVYNFSDYYFSSTIIISCTLHFSTLFYITNKAIILFYKVFWNHIKISWKLLASPRD